MNRPPIQPAAERYLDRLRAALRGLPAAEIEEILLELRGHIAERTESPQGVEGALEALGDPELLARQYRTDLVTTRAARSGGPLAVLQSLLLLRRGSVLGWLVLAVTALGYAWGLVLVAAAIEKIVSPHDVGLWIRTGAASLPRLRVDGPGPAGTREMLGWWFVPFGIATGALVLFLARQVGLWWIRRYRAKERDDAPGPGAASDRGR
jgi:HAAS